MATFVLVPGAWHGGWCWKAVSALLRARDHEVFAATLTGLGERSHLSGPNVNLSTHVQDIVGLLTYEDLERVVLVGHSYAGMVITGVAERTPERLAQLIYLDAFVPEAGQALVDILAPDPQLRTAMEERVRSEGDGWSLPSLRPGPWEPFLREAWRITDEADLHWVMARLDPQPYATMTEAVRRANPAAATLPRTYVRCALVPHPHFDRFAATAKRSGSEWRYRELASGHDAMITAPREVADLLSELAKEDGKEA
jgi:pimeloyl-ACP methyl ester carboxylesterase